MTHGINAHETAAYTVQTGRTPGDARRLPERRRGGLAVQGLRRRLQGADSALHRAHRAAGPVLRSGVPRVERYKPFATGGDPASRASPSRASSRRASPTSGSSDRRELLQQLDTLGTRSQEAGASLDGVREIEEQAYDLILGDAGKVFDLSQEKDDVRDRYGRNTFGQSCLVARRLVERGVPYITINYQGWDTHKQNFPTMRQQAAGAGPGPGDAAAGLVRARPADSTIVWWSGEFGRTPKVQWEAPWNGGRGHWGRCSPRWWPAAASRAATWSARRSARARRSGPAGVPGATYRQHVRTAGHRPRGEAAASRKASTCA